MKLARQSLPRCAPQGKRCEPLSQGAEISTRPSPDHLVGQVTLMLKVQIFGSRLSAGSRAGLHDGIERFSTHDIFDILEVPMRHRSTQTIRLSKVIRGLRWSNVRARSLNPSSYRDRVRGYAREVPGHPATLQLPNEF